MGHAPNIGVAIGLAGINTGLASDLELTPMESRLAVDVELSGTPMMGTVRLLDLVST